MGTKSKPKVQPNGADLKTEKKKKLWLLRVFRKRKYKSLSEENIHGLDVHDQTDDSPVFGGDSGVLPPKRDMQEDIVVEKMSEVETNYIHNKGNGVLDSNKDTAKEKKRIIDSAFNFLKHPFMFRKRRKHYSGFSNSTEDLVESKASNDNDIISSPANNETNIESSSDKSNKETAATSKKCVRFEDIEESNRDTVFTTADDIVAEEHNEPATTRTPKKKKKSTRKRVIMAGRTTCKMFGKGMIQTGKNLQYLSPIPTAHVFADSLSKTTGGRNMEPKKRTYKYTASAPTTNAYAFI